MELFANGNKHIIHHMTFQLIPKLVIRDACFFPVSMLKAVTAELKRHFTLQWNNLGTGLLCGRSLRYLGTG